MIDCYNTGVFTGKIIRLISDIRAKHGKDSVNLENCGKFTLAEDLADISDMTSIDLSSINSLDMVATNYILTQSMMDMMRFTDKEYYDN